jgi:hypothetical protein
VKPCVVTTFGKRSVVKAARLRLLEFRVQLPESVVVMTSNGVLGRLQFLRPLPASRINEEGMSVTNKRRRVGLSIARLGFAILYSGVPLCAKLYGLQAPVSRDRPCEREVIHCGSLTQTLRRSHSDFPEVSIRGQPDIHCGHHDLLSTLDVRRLELAIREFYARFKAGNLRTMHD